MKKLPFVPLLLIALLLLGLVRARAAGYAALSPAGKRAGAQLATTTIAPAQSSALALGIVVVTLREFVIEMPSTVSAGSLSFAVTNLGQQRHNFAVVGEGVEHRFVRDLQPGESQSMFITLLPGTYQVYSPADDDRGKGMLATLTVTGEISGRAAGAGPRVATPASAALPPTAGQVVAGGTAPATPVAPLGAAAATAPAAGGTPIPTPTIVAPNMPGSSTVVATPITYMATTVAGAPTPGGTRPPAAIGTVLPRPSATIQSVPGIMGAATPVVNPPVAGLAPRTAASGIPSGSATRAVVPASVAPPTTSANGSTPGAAGAGALTTAAAPVATVAPTVPASMAQPPATAGPGTSPGGLTAAAGTPTATAAVGVSQAAGLMPVNTIIGFSVKDSAGKDLGHISELAGSLGAGKVTYAILTSGGILGLGGQSAAVPWSLLRLDQGQQAFVVSTDQQTVQQAPGFDQSAIDRADANWDATLRTYWRNHGAPAGGSSGDQNPVRVSQLLRSSAKASSEANLGTITSILIAVPPGGAGLTPAQVTPTVGNTVPDATRPPAGSATGTEANSGATGSTPAESGRFTYAIVGYGGILGFGEQAVPVPWSAFTVDPKTRTFTGKFNEQTFQQAPTIDIARLPQTPSAGWDTAIQTYWSGRIGTP